MGENSVAVSRHTCAARSSEEPVSQFEVLDCFLDWAGIADRPARQQFLARLRPVPRGMAVLEGGFWELGFHGCDHFLVGDGVIGGDGLDDDLLDGPFRLGFRCCRFLIVFLLPCCFCLLLLFAVHRFPPGLVADRA